MDTKVFSYHTAAISHPHCGAEMRDLPLCLCILLASAGLLKSGENQ